MTSSVATAFTAVTSTFLLFLSLYHIFLHHHQPTITNLYLYSQPNALLQQDIRHHNIGHHINTTVSVLLPAWEILIIAPLETSPLAGNLTCLFLNNISSPARLAGTLAFPDRTAFKCELPSRLRRLPLPQPTLVASTEISLIAAGTKLLRWNYLAYDSLSTQDDLILFVKGINRRPRKNRPISEFGCVVSGVRTAVTTAAQEVFRCRHPWNLTDFDGKITLQIKSPKQNVTVLVPTVAYYAPPHTVASSPKQKFLICACTMVYNVAKFLKEWVIYHSAIGVERFIFYNNDSDDNLLEVVNELISRGFKISTFFWLWPKTQEAGFSHCAVVHNDTCTWMMYLDVDEFVYAPKWVVDSSQPLKGMLDEMVNGWTDVIGQVMIGCYEFGPSGKRENPVEGVTQGYNCRRRDVNRHKSIVRLDAVDESLVNVIHHFKLKPGYRSMRMRIEDGVVNHYKYQAWAEFKTKYRRRVSAYVADWSQPFNLASKDRAPGLGLVPVEPPDWPQRFCQVYDNNLRNLTQVWFGYHSPVRNYLAWQR